MLEDGGMLVSPSKDGKRPGYRRSNYDTSGGGLRSNTAEKGSMGPSQAGGAGVGRDKDFQQRGESKQDYQRTSQQYKDSGTQQVYGAGRDEQYPGTTEMGEVGVVPVPKEKTQKKLKKTLRDKNKFLIPSIFNREFMFNLSEKLPKFGAPTTKEKQQAFKEYLESMGVTNIPTSLDDKNPFAFFESDAFGYEPKVRGQPQATIQNYGDFALENFGTPGIKFSGDVGNKEVFVKGYRDDGSKIYGVREKRDDGPGDQILPTTTPTDPTDPEDPEDPNQSTDVFAGIAPRFAGSIFDFDALRRQLEEQSAADGGRIGAMEGGIMDLETAREAMFLGGIVKGLKKITKKATRAVKKVAKSPIGKAALLGLGAYYMPGFGIKATGGFSNFTQPGGFLSKILTKGGDKALNLDNLSGLKIAGLLSAAPFLFGKPEEEDDPDPNRGPKLTMEELLAIRGAPFNTLAPRFTGSTFAAEGGRMGYQQGSKEPVAKKVMPLLDMGGKEMDLRDNGGFVPIGRMEKADDVPARLSKNEFVFTAEAVRNAGDGDVDKGSEVMYNMMKNLEDGGNVSEESQGLEGARDMFQTAQRLQEII
jgi:hypothetical protein